MFKINNIYRHDIPEILLKVALNTITITLILSVTISVWSRFISSSFVCPMAIECDPFNLNYYVTVWLQYWIIFIYDLNTCLNVHKFHR